MCTKLDSSDLVRRIGRGEDDAFALLYDDLRSLLLRVVTDTVRNRAISEEVTQEVFLEMWRSIERFDPARAPLLTWATMIARRRAVDRVRYEQAQRERDTTYVTTCADDHSSVDDKIMAEIETERLRDAVDALPCVQRPVIHLAFVDGLTQQAISDRLGLPLGTVKSRTRTSLRALRYRLENDQ